MSDLLQHECGIGFLRLLKPLSFYYQKYGNALWGMNKLYLLMEKQHNRGQDGAGLASLKIDHPAGLPYLQRLRSNDSSPLKDIYRQLSAEIESYQKLYPNKLHDEVTLRRHFSFSGDVLMGHVRYGTHGENTINTIHPFERKNNWKTKNILVSGNFNLTNVSEIMDILIEAGQHPKNKDDTITILENLGYHFDEENDYLYQKYKEKNLSKREITAKISIELDIIKVLRNSVKRWDGAYVIQGILGHGDAFIMRDPHGIRPAFYYVDDEIVVAASERSAIATVFDIKNTKIQELGAAKTLIVRKNGNVFHEYFTAPKEKRSCSFERIYFSRGNDSEIYKERKKLGKLLVPQVMEAIDGDIKNTVFSYIPNTAETAFIGMMEGINEELNRNKLEEIDSLHKSNNFTRAKLKKILEFSPKIEKAAIKDIKLRTFITDDAHRGDMIAHIYDTTHGILDAGVDNLVVIDDSIVRGSTLKDSILHILYRLRPKKIVIVSSAPQIRYPDCYGIDMSNLNSLIAFKAAIEELKDIGKQDRIDSVYENCKALLKRNKEIEFNPVNRIFENLTDDIISERIVELIKPKEMACEVKLVFQTIGNLHDACPDHSGDWYFSGNFPTAGGNQVACKAFVNFYEGHDERAY